jgi:hypothetical protein
MIIYDSINNSFIIERELSTLLLHTRLMRNETIRNSRWPPQCNNINILPMDDGVLVVYLVIGRIPSSVKQNQMNNCGGIELF